MRLDEFLLDLGPDLRVQQRDVQHVVFVEHLPADAQLLRHQADGRDAAAFAVAAVVHLAGRLVDVPAGHGFAAAESHDAAAAFLLASLRIGLRGLILHAFAPVVFRESCQVYVINCSVHSLLLHVIRIIQMHQQIGSSAKLGDAAHAEAPEEIDQLACARRCTG